MEKWLPKEIVYRKKKGFDNPISDWLKRRLKSYTNDLLLSRNSAVTDYFNQSYIKEMIDLHQAGKEHYLRHLYLLISFELWHRKFINKLL